MLKGHIQSNRSRRTLEEGLVVSINGGEAGLDGSISGKFIYNEKSLGELHG